VLDLSSRQDDAGNRTAVVAGQKYPVSALRPASDISTGARIIAGSLARVITCRTASRLNAKFSGGVNEFPQIRATFPLVCCARLGLRPIRAVRTWTTGRHHHRLDRCGSAGRQDRHGQHGDEYQLHDGSRGNRAVYRSEFEPGHLLGACRKEGFRPSVTSGMAIDAGANVREDVSLEIGSSTQAVEAIALQTDSARSQRVITDKLISDLPTVVSGNLRSPFDLAILTPEAKNFGDNNVRSAAGRRRASACNSTAFRRTPRAR
jgi:hypothetical protein